MIKINYKYCIVGIVAGFLNGIFGAGGGSVLVPILKYYLKIEDRSSHATTIAIILPLCIFSSIFYIKNSFIDFRILLFVSIGGIIGGFLGAKLLNFISTKLLRKIFGLVLILTAIKAVL